MEGFPTGSPRCHPIGVSSGNGGVHCHVRVLFETRRVSTRTIFVQSQTTQKNGIEWICPSKMLVFFFLWPLVIDRAPDLVPLKIEVVRMSRPGEQLVASRVGQGRSHGQGCGKIMLHSIHAAKYG